MIKKHKLSYISYIFILLIIITYIFSYTTNAFTHEIDLKVREFVQDSDNDFIKESMSKITYLGNGAVDFGIASILPDREARRDAQKAVLISGLAVTAFKTIIGKKRPPGPIKYEPFNFEGGYEAMPSGHTTTAFALATTISYHYPEYNKFAYTLAILVGVSRLYEDVHWMTDVVAGAGVGYLSARFVEYSW